MVFKCFFVWEKLNFMLAISEIFRYRERIRQPESIRKTKKTPPTEISAGGEGQCEISLQE